MKKPWEIHRRDFEALLQCPNPAVFLRERAEPMFNGYVFEFVMDKNIGMPVTFLYRDFNGEMKHVDYVGSYDEGAIKVCTLFREKCGSVQKCRESNEQAANDIIDNYEKKLEVIQGISRAFLVRTTRFRILRHLTILMLARLSV